MSVYLVSSGWFGMVVFLSIITIFARCVFHCLAVFTASRAVFGGFRHGF